MQTETRNLSPTEIAEDINLSLPESLYCAFENTGGGIMCIVITPDEDPSVESETALYFGTAEGFLGWSDYFGEKYGSFPNLVASDDDYRAWESNEPISNGRKIVAKILEVAETYFDLKPDPNDPNSILTCADKAITLIEMSEISEVLDDLQNLEQLAERVDWNHFLTEACDHVEAGDFGTDFAIAHLNAINVAADLMIQGTEDVLDHLYNFLKIEQVARGPHCLACDKVDADHGDEDHPFAPTKDRLSANPGDPLAEAWAAVHAQLEDLTPTEGLEVLRRVREDLREQTIEAALDEHFASAPEPIEGLRAQLDFYGLQITEKE